MARKMDLAKREAIIISARKLFKEKGVEDTTIYQIAAKAGIATGTVYLYFKSKMEIIDELCNRYLRDSVKSIYPTPGLAPEKAIAHMIHASLIYASNNADIVRLIDRKRSFAGIAQRPEANKVVQKEIRSWLEYYIEEGGFIKYSPAILAEMLGGLIESVSKICFVWSHVDHNRYEDTLVELLCNALLKKPQQS
jgi:AcrR family transcriptional regulator